MEVNIAGMVQHVVEELGASFVGVFSLKIAARMIFFSNNLERTLCSAHCAMLRYSQLVVLSVFGQFSFLR